MESCVLLLHREWAFKMGLFFGMFSDAVCILSSELTEHRQSSCIDLVS